MRKKHWFDGWARKSPNTLIWFLTLCMLLIYTVFAPLESGWRVAQEIYRACTNWSWYTVFAPFRGLGADIRAIRENVTSASEEE